MQNRVIFEVGSSKMREAKSVKGGVGILPRAYKEQGDLLVISQGMSF